MSLTFKDIIDKATAAASIAAKTRVQNTQINQLLAILNGNADPEEAVLMVAAFVMRQSARHGNYISRELAQQITLDLKFIQEKAPKGRMRESTRKYLGLLKWMFEVIDNNRNLKKQLEGGKVDFRELTRAFPNA